jgi:riboflavin synthase
MLWATALRSTAPALTATSLDPANHRFTIDGPNRWTRPDRNRHHQPGKACAADRLGGHIVSAMSDGLATSPISPRWAGAAHPCAAVAGRSTWPTKGSITVNGVSLTVNRAGPGGDADEAPGCEISINLIPHTVENTALGQLVQARRSTWKST